MLIRVDWHLRLAKTTIISGTPLSYFLAHSSLVASRTQVSWLELCRPVLATSCVAPTDRSCSLTTASGRVTNLLRDSYKILLLHLTLPVIGEGICLSLIDCVVRVCSGRTSRLPMPNVSLKVPILLLLLEHVLLF